MTTTTNKIATTQIIKIIKQAATQPLLSNMLSAAKGRKPPTTRSFR
jgi:hypothetical protein